ncbi:hypothetical protein K466DRAFT_32946 [Polyporus arcularius HHB13444]|uniref:Uncharacterized protein n=1 Tax=Polyporus arcularius HHB13444 TaxID=1314778 RepID=A0A5C3PHR3_9APHY|nr:hypothetical protein K466DRAFT_32946 [Polyporus arcularius HHB13444]
MLPDVAGTTLVDDSDPAPSSVSGSASPLMSFKAGRRARPRRRACSRVAPMGRPFLSSSDLRCPRRLPGMAPRIHRPGQQASQPGHRRRLRTLAYRDSHRRCAKLRPAAAQTRSSLCACGVAIALVSAGMRPVRLTIRGNGRPRASPVVRPPRSSSSRSESQGCAQDGIASPRRDWQQPRRARMLHSQRHAPLPCRATSALLPSRMSWAECIPEGLGGPG